MSSGTLLLWGQGAQRVRLPGRKDPHDDWQGGQRNAAQRRLSAGSRAASTRRLVKWPGRLPRPRHSNNRVMTENVLRCYFCTSQAYPAARSPAITRAGPSSSSRCQRSRRTSVGWPGSSPSRRRWLPMRGVSVRLCRNRVHGISTVASCLRSNGATTVKAPSRRQSPTCLSLPRLLQQNLPTADSCTATKIDAYSITSLASAALKT